MLRSVLQRLVESSISRLEKKQPTSNCFDSRFVVLVPSMCKSVPSVCLLGSFFATMEYNMDAEIKNHRLLIVKQIKNKQTIKVLTLLLNAVW